MKARLQTSLGQSLVMTPQLRQAIRLLQMSSTELEQELAEAAESNPLLEWDDDAGGGETATDGAEAPALDPADDGDAQAEPTPADAVWSGGHGGSFDDDDDGSAAERVEIGRAHV